MHHQIIGIIVTLFYRLYTSTFRYYLYFEDQTDIKTFFQDTGTKDPRPGKNLLYAFFHQDELCTIPYFANKNICVLVSKSKDGTIISTLAHMLGYQTVRGSSSKGAVAGLLASLKMVQKGHKLSMAVDGPRGPIYKVKDGLPSISLKTKCKIAPFRAITNQCFVSHKSWNKIKLPYPFSRVNLVFGKFAVYDSKSLEEKLLSLGDFSKFQLVVDRN